MKKLIEEARERKASGQYNCAQAVACTFAPAVGADPETLRSVAHAFGTGMGCLEGTCGAIVGAGLILSLRHGDRARAMQAMKRVVTSFDKRNGATVCRQLKGVDTGRPLRHCNDCVADAAEFLAIELDGLK